MIGELAALGAAICWTVSAIMYKEALLKAKPISANIMRCVSASIILVAFLIVVGKFGVLTNLSTYSVVLTCVSGIVGLGFGDTLYMTSLKLIGVAQAVPITCTYPLFNLLWAVFLVGEPITSSVVLGATTIVFGIWLLSQKKETHTNGKQNKKLVIGVACALAAAILWSVGITMIDMAVKETHNLDHALAINTIRVMAIAISLLASVPLIDRDFGFLKMQRKTSTALIFGGIVALGLGWFFLTYSFINTLESRAVPISSTTPLFSTLSAMIFLHERVTIKNVFGSILIVVGIFLIFAV